RGPVDRPNRLAFREELERPLGGRQRLLEHPRGRLWGQPVHGVLAHLGELTELAEGPGVQAERAVRTGRQQEAVNGRQSGPDRLGQMPAVAGLLLLGAAVFAEFPQGREALVRGPAEQLEMRPCQVAHGTSNRWEKGVGKTEEKPDCTTCLSGAKKAST